MVVAFDLCSLLWLKITQWQVRAKQLLSSLVFT